MLNTGFCACLSSLHRSTAPSSGGIRELQVIDTELSNVSLFFLLRLNRYQPAFIENKEL